MADMKFVSFDADGVSLHETLDAGTNRIVNLGEPSSSSNAATKNYVDTAVASYLPLAGGTMSGALGAAGGTSAAPGYTFSGDTNTGFFRQAENSIGVANGGVERFRFSSGSNFYGVATTGSAMLRSAVGTATTPAHAFYGDDDSGMYHYSANVVGFSAGTHPVVRMKQATENSSASTRGVGALIVRTNDKILDSTAGSIIGAQSWGWSVGNSLNLELQAVRDSVGSDWQTAAIGFRRITDVTTQASLWFYRSAVGINISSPGKTLTVAGTFSARPGTTASAANAYWNNYTGSEYELLRSTSSRRYKDEITTALGLADVDLRPVRYWSKLDQQYQYGLIAEEVAAAIPEAAVHNAADEIENFDDRAVLAVLLAKVNRLEKRLNALDN